MTADPGVWHRVEAADVPADGRVRTVEIAGRSVALTRCGERLGALANRCPHQGGPLGEGSIENGWLRCPWHGYDYDPISGRPPQGFTDGAITLTPWAATSNPPANRSSCRVTSVRSDSVTRPPSAPGPP